MFLVEFLKQSPINEAVQLSAEQVPDSDCTLEYVQPTSPLTSPSQHDRTAKQLKPCIKRKVDSPTGSLPDEMQKTPGVSIDQTLRRVKTVDFDQSRMKPSQFAQALGEGSKEMVEIATNQPIKLTVKTQKPALGSPTCPVTIGTSKSSPANPEVTRADVRGHSMPTTVTPTIKTSLEASSPGSLESQSPDSENSCGTSCSNDTPATYNVHTQNYSLDPPTRNLDHVNTKLSTWSSNHFIPPILVYPDVNNGRSIYYNCSVDESDELVPGPPNSHRTSAAPSRLPSRPASAPLTRHVSSEDVGETSRTTYDDELCPKAVDTSNKQSSAHNVEAKSFNTRPVFSQPFIDNPTNTPSISHFHAHAHGLAPLRRLSDTDEATLQFIRTHRDSVALARTRMLSEADEAALQFIRTHRDSVALAKTRIGNVRREGATPVSVTLALRRGEGGKGGGLGGGKRVGVGLWIGDGVGGGKEMEIEDGEGGVSGMAEEMEVRWHE